jgi:hypothetical protein
MVGQSAEKLDGWKRVAEHLGRTVRTVQRWERELGLPVHHAGRSKGYSVFAYASELDEWLRAQSGEHGSQETAPTPSANAVVVSRPVVNNRRYRTRIALIAAAGAILGAALVVAFGKVERRYVEIGAITFSGQEALAWNGGKEVWSYDFERALRTVEPGELSRKYKIQDLNGDGKKEILVAAPLLLFKESEPSTDALYCFSARGKVLWHDSYNQRVHFGAEDCGPRWEIRSLMVTGQGADQKTWTAACSYPTSVGILAKTDTNGNRINYFVNYGHLVSMGEFRPPSGSYVLAGGINNEYDCAMLAVLRETGPAGRSPQTGSRAECDVCPEGQPLRYFLFPRSEINRVGGPAYNEVHAELLTGHGFSVKTRELGPDDIEGGVPDWALYEFSDDFVPLSVKFSDHYWQDHRRFAAEGKIGHDVESCPERLKPITVREWTAERGWRNIQLPPIAPGGN